MGVRVLDDYFVSITLLVTIAYQLTGFAIAFTFQIDKLTDIAGATNFVLLAALTLGFSPTHSTRQILASVLLMVWAARLGGFLLFRILMTGKDDRFDEMRAKFISFLGFWLFQMAWVWSVSLPVTILNSPRVAGSFPQPPFGTAADIAGVVLWALGFVVEAVADAQKYRFRSNEANKGRTLDVGLFAWSRHPNYFGEITVQFAIFTLTISPAVYGYVPSGTGAYAAQYASVIGPVFLTFLLLFVSGLTLQERPGAKKKYEKDGPGGPSWSQHKQWLDNTSILLPMPQAIWKSLPMAAKRTVGLEWPLYVFDPAKHADQKKVRDNEAEQGRADRPRSDSHDGLVENRN